MTWPVRRSANRRGGLVGAVTAIIVAILSAVAAAYLAPRPVIEPPPQFPQQQSNSTTRTETRTDGTVAEPAATILETGSTANEARPDATLDTGVWVEPVRRVKPITPPESEDNPVPVLERKPAP